MTERSRRVALAGTYISLVGVWLVAVGRVAEFAGGDGGWPTWPLVMAIVLTVVAVTLHRGVLKRPEDA